MNDTPYGHYRAEAYRRMGLALKARLERRGHVAFYVDTAQEAKEKVLELIPPGASVGVPGTATIREIGAIEALEARGNTVVHHWDPQLTAEQRDQARFDENLCDVFLTSSNAITEGGVLVNIDGAGNRLAGMCWSRGDRIFVVGINKLCHDTASAIQRCHNPAAVINAVRFKVESAQGHVATEPLDSEGICRVTLITELAPTMPIGKKSYVIVVGQALGY